jgi:hypothetical protein
MIHRQKLFLLQTVAIFMALLCLDISAQTLPIDGRRNPLRQRAMQDLAAERDIPVPTTAPVIIEYWSDQEQQPTAAPVIIDYWPLHPPTTKPVPNFVSRILAILHSLFDSLFRGF